jgi:RNA polymerase sigma-70 factor (ECF subfamily)
MPRSILQRIADGDPAAVRACLDEYGDTVWAIAHRYLAPLGEDVDDAVQEIFVELWKCAGRFDPAKGSEPGFIATIAHRRLINRQRRAARHRSVALTHVAEPATTATPQPSENLHEEARAAADAFNKLTEDEKQLLHLSIHHGLSHERIAKATDLPLGTVKTRIRRGLIRLRQMLGDSSLPSHAHAASGGHP